MLARRVNFDARAYRRLQVNLLALFAGYALVAAGSFVVFRRVETFPLFAFNLFDVVPNVRETCQILIHEVDGTVMAPPQPHTQLRAWFAEPAVSTSLGIVADRLAHAIDRNPARAAELRAVVEDNWLHAREHVRYEIVLNRLDPLELRRTGHVRETRSLGVFERSFAP
jgi:hypothetical protein